MPWSSGGEAKPLEREERGGGHVFLFRKAHTRTAVACARASSTFTAGHVPESWYGTLFAIPGRVARGIVMPSCFARKVKFNSDFNVRRGKYLNMYKH